MKSLDLRKKDRVVLVNVVESFLLEGKPVGSDTITRKRILPDSPATIRNSMVRLEKLGYLFKPHASAGRVPSDKGLRLYVNSLLDMLAPSSERTVLLPEEALPGRGDLNSLLSRVSLMLADESDNLGFVLSPRISRIHFKHLRFIRVADNKVMVILLATFNLVLNEIVSLEQDLGQGELDEAARFMNQNFRGKTLQAVLDYLEHERPPYRQRREPVTAKLSLLLKAYLLQEERSDSIFFQGTSRLLDKSRDIPLEKLKALFRHFEEKARLAKIISDFISLDRVKVLIGSEQNDPDIADCALILSHYGTESQVLGSLGIIGPKRIPYHRIIPLVDSIALRLSQTIRHNP
ncbi:MAG: heat-inducible transcription repressor HrcA [Candidatus Aminicenantes bacterium]|nr:heat-inducible transcription repressor HrcA [Candidatus Aminicenantes bacterium]